MTEDKLFNLLVARTQTRETSTLAVVIIAASTSLVLLGFVCPVNDEQRNYIACIGILYPLLGIAYREITYVTIQNHDYDKIRKHFSAEKVDIVRGGQPKFARRAIFYLLFAVLPIAAWAFVLTGKIC